MSRNFERAILSAIEAQNETLRIISDRLGRMEGVLVNMNEDVLALKLAMHTHEDDQ
jgi:hypothetical protein